jgi:hypothetical protein
VKIKVLERVGSKSVQAVGARGRSVQASSPAPIVAVPLADLVSGTLHAG